VAESCGLAERAPLALAEGEQLQVEGIEAPSSWQALLAGQIAQLRVHPREPPASTPKILFPGAFHPLHAGHLGMAAVAMKLLGDEIDFEITIVNADKPAIDFLEIERRVRQFLPEWRLWLTRAPTFVEKSLLFPGVTFLVGVDTLERIAAARFYGDDPRALERAIDTLAAQGCRFLVFGRAAGEGFRTLGDLELPSALLRLCREVPAAEFRIDCSSTELRRQADSDEE
jgi:hypothetical protein